MQSLADLSTTPEQEFGKQGSIALEFDHLGLIVPDLDAGREFLTTALGISRWTKVIDDPRLKVSVQFGSMPTGGLNYELIAPLGDDSPISNALRSGKHMLNHLAYLTPDLTRSGEHLRASGCSATGPAQPAAAYNRALVQFWMSPLRFVIELIEKPGHQHSFTKPSGAKR
jgi:methylmalonyl-CoA/ethylmalonyl-CoA epimerase